MSEAAYEISNTFALSSSATGTAARGTMLDVLRRRIIRHHCHMLSLGAFVCYVTCYSVYVKK
jgi:hypothetical protein